MKRWTVFYANLLYGEYSTDEGLPRDLPDGAFIRERAHAIDYWYEHKWCSFVPINKCDIPPEVKVLALLMS